MKLIKRLSRIANNIVYITVDHVEGDEHLKGCLVAEFGDFSGNKKLHILAKAVHFSYSSDGNDRGNTRPEPNEVDIDEIKELFVMPGTKMYIVSKEELPNLLESLELLYGKEDDERTKNPSIC